MSFDPDPSKWLRHLIPLPHEIVIEGTVVCHPRAVVVRTRSNAGPVERQAAEELERLFARQCQASPEEIGFTLFLCVVEEAGLFEGITVDPTRLRACPNADQAYLICPEGPNGLVLAALSERGIRYAARTLCQLLEPAFSEDRVTLPLVRALDWPDFEERGLWNFPDPPDWIPWLASLKLNYGKMSDTRLHPVKRGMPNRADIDTRLYQEARLLGFRYTPFLLHLNFLHEIGLFRTYPELAGKGDSALTGRYFAHKQGNQHRVPCASHPFLVTVLKEWLEDIARQGADEVSCWLSERPGQCGCPACTSVGQFTLEARAFMAAWKLARETWPDLQIRLFLSTTTVEQDYFIIAEADPEIKIERACADEIERVRRLPRDLFVNPLLDSYAHEGRWIATYDVPVNANGRVDTPEFKVPERSAHRIRNYVEQLARRRYRGVYGMMAWANLGREICGFNICALAEWTWNTAGRTEKEFAIAWAVREGYSDPEAVGEWSELMGPVAFDVYDSDFPICYSWGLAVALVRDRRRPCFGEGMFRYYRNTDDFDRKRKVCDRALQIAETVGYADLAHETRVIRSYVEVAHCIFVVADQRATLDLSDLECQATLWSSVERLKQAGTDNTQAIRAWRAALGPAPWHPRVLDAIAAMETTVKEITQFIAERDAY